jgi:DNA-binding Lrp family transcriptional regulator
LNKEAQVLKKTQKEATITLENLGKGSGITDVSITNRIQETEERISGV